MFTRVLFATSLLALAACGGASQKPASSEADTSSLENGAAPAAAPASEAAPATATASAPAADSKPAEAPAAAAPARPVPGASGSLDGTPFAPKLAQIVGPVGKDGRALIVIHEGSDCTATPPASISLMVPYKDGYKTDLSSLRRAKGASMGEAAFVRNDGKKKQISTKFSPTGLVTVVSASTAKDSVGKLKIDLQNGDYMLNGDLDVKVCTP